MSGGKSCQQGLHICLLGDRHVCWDEQLCLHHHRFWEEAKADLPCEGEDLPALQDGLCKGRGPELSALEHADVWLWSLKTHHE